MSVTSCVCIFRKHTKCQFFTSCKFQQCVFISKDSKQLQLALAGNTPLVPDHRGGNGMKWQQQGLPTTENLDQDKAIQDSTVATILKKAMLCSTDGLMIVETCTNSIWRHINSFKTTRLKPANLQTLPVLWEEVKEQYTVWRDQTSPGIDNAPAELLKQDWN